ncbi:MAG: DUF502 domain-containing protein [Burkholderiaceae bacterium]|jgi:uncharacterized membrane protein
MKRYLVTGLLIWVPLAVTLWVLNTIVAALDQTLLLLPLSWQPLSLWGFYVPGMGVLLTLGVLWVTGLFATNFIGQRLVRWWDGLLRRIPFFNSIYGSVKQVSDTLLSSSGQAFRQAVLVPYPHAQSWSIGFLTGPAPLLVSQLQPAATVSVFVPTAPNPTSGFVLLLPATSVQPLGLSVDDALKYIVSMGVVAPPVAASPHSSLVTQP